jgi:uncharacterized protein (DUF1330 family)
MKTMITVGASMIAGIALGMTITGLQAQNKAPGAYAVVDISEITDQNTFRQDLLPRVTTTTLAAAGGRYIIRSERFTALDGMPPSRFVVIAFDSMDKAKAWDADPSQQEVNALRKRSAKSRQFLVEGFPPI